MSGAVGWGGFVSGAEIACVIYAAKSTEDRRGSISGQVRECTDAIAVAQHRGIVAEYRDEAFSAYSASRGPGLVEAITHVEELAGEGREAELWAQHSDRLARGDGRSARHAVEIALWALKQGVRVRTVQDPDTFRDLLYAVVTGQRNHEDSRRKGLATAAGMRRATERGECMGTRPDGYRFAIAITDSGVITKHLEIDPQRRAAIELIFRLVLRGKRTGAIASALNEAGWLTKPLVRSRRARSWTCHSVLGILHNPRYAGLATLKGEVIGHGSWPAYITERQHHRIRTQLAARRPTPPYRPVECYLLARIARCGLCGSPMHVHTGMPRKDGTLARRYACSSHSRDRDKKRCAAPLLDADVLEPMFIAALPALLLDGKPSMPSIPRPASAEVPWTQSAERQGVLTAMLAGDDTDIDLALSRLLDRAAPKEAMLRELMADGRRARQHILIQRLEAWLKIGVGKPTEASRKELAELRQALISLFSGVTLAQTSSTITIIVQHRGSTDSAKQSSAQFDRREWRRVSPSALKARHAFIVWNEADILGALQRWADTHGAAPRSSDWQSASVEHPSSNTVRKRFTSWARALQHAGLKPANPRPAKRWQNDEITTALNAWSTRHGRPPRPQEWAHGTPWRPCKTTVCNRFGNWPAALAAANLSPGLPPA
jgi:DNA invertase Pin-like site-specific DNA recombinase